MTELGIFRMSEIRRLLRSSTSDLVSVTPYSRLFGIAFLCSIEEGVWYQSIH